MHRYMCSKKCPHFFHGLALHSTTGSSLSHTGHGLAMCLTLFQHGREWLRLVKGPGLDQLWPAQKCQFIAWNSSQSQVPGLSETLFCRLTGWPLRQKRLGKIWIFIIFMSSLAHGIFQTFSEPARSVVARLPLAPTMKRRFFLVFCWHFPQKRSLQNAIPKLVGKGLLFPTATNLPSPEKCFGDSAPRLEQDGRKRMYVIFATCCWWRAIHFWFCIRNWAVS